VELLSINGEPTTPIPAALQSFILAFGPQLPGCDLPRNVRVQLNRLTTVVGRFGANMKSMGLCGSDLYECGKVQTAHHILHNCTKFKPPCHINEVDNPAILEYLTQSKFWPTCILFVYWKEERLSCTISGFITLGLLLRSGCVPCSFSARRAPGKKATVPINKVLVRLGRVELSPYSTEADALTTRPGGPNTSVPFHDWEKETKTVTRLLLISNKINAAPSITNQRSSGTSSSQKISVFSSWFWNSLVLVQLRYQFVAANWKKDFVKKQFETLLISLMVSNKI